MNTSPAAVLKGLSRLIRCVTVSVSNAISISPLIKAVLPPDAFSRGEGKQHADFDQCLEFSKNAEQVIAAVDNLPAKLLGLELARQSKVTKDMSVDAAGPGCFFFIQGQAALRPVDGDHDLSNDLPDQLFDLVLGKFQPHDCHLVSEASTFPLRLCSNKKNRSHSCGKNVGSDCEEASSGLLPA